MHPLFDTLDTITNDMERKEFLTRLTEVWETADPNVIEADLESLVEKLPTYERSGTREARFSAGVACQESIAKGLHALPTNVQKQWQEKLITRALTEGDFNYPVRNMLAISYIENADQLVQLVDNALGSKSYASIQANDQKRNGFISFLAKTAHIAAQCNFKQIVSRLKPLKTPHLHVVVTGYDHGSLSTLAAVNVDDNPHHTMVAHGMQILPLGHVDQAGSEIGTAATHLLESYKRTRHNSTNSTGDEYYILASAIGIPTKILSLG